MKYMRTFIWMAVFLFCWSIASAQKTERKNVKEGNKLYEEEKYTESEIAYRKSLEANPRSIEGSFNLGNALYKQEKWKEATEQYQLLTGQAERIVSTSEGRLRMADVMHNTGNIFMKNKDYANSIEAYKQSLRLNPYDDETRYNLALAQKLLQDQQNQDNSQDNKDQQEQEEQNEQEDQQQQQNQPDDQKQDKTQEEEQPNEQMSQNNAQQILDAFLQDEKDTQEKVKKIQQQQQQRRRTDKEW